MGDIGVRKLSYGLLLGVVPPYCGLLLGFSPTREEFLLGIIPPVGVVARSFPVNFHSCCSCCSRIRLLELTELS